jgi:XTP/dITP diphosphohydrolase
MNATLYFVTTNQRKYDEYKASFENINVDLVQYSAELVEPQTTDSHEIARHKLDQAKQLLPGDRVLVDDRSFVIPALNGFPGPMLKLTMHTIGTDGLLALMQPKDDRTAIFVTSLGYFDGREDHIVLSEEVGFITPGRQGKNLHGWGELVSIYGHESFPGRSLAELNEPEWESYLARITRDDAISDITRTLSTKILSVAKE